ncbi:hypothetical protein Q5P01_003274 [Channa striata]|uniref:Uncharacterized protein n=1 Tax=Channa striata TaxID=64152 RepID=A0AA88NGU0_CHASR|nr:hypothetical protein Q5P01_003274 [Channa striata]
MKFVSRSASPFHSTSGTIGLGRREQPAALSESRGRCDRRLWPPPPLQNNRCPGCMLRTPTPCWVQPAPGQLTSHPPCSPAASCV